MQFLKNIAVLLLSLLDVIFMSVDEQVIVLGKYGYQSLFFGL